MIFIGGTVRSGTTVLAKILGMHPDVFVFPGEVRFITDPDGIISLNNGLVHNWSYFQADLAMERFLKLMKMLEKPYQSKYPNSRLGKIVGNAFYNDWLDLFLKEYNVVPMENSWGRRTTLLRKALIKFIGRNKFTNLFQLRP